MNFTISERLEISNLLNLRDKKLFTLGIKYVFAGSRDENIMPSWSASNCQMQQGN